jgi:hypothetical protein
MTTATEYRERFVKREETETSFLILNELKHDENFSINENVVSLISSFRYT